MKSNVNPNKNDVTSNIYNDSSKDISRKVSNQPFPQENIYIENQRQELQNVKESLNAQVPNNIQETKNIQGINDLQVENDSHGINDMRRTKAISGKKAQNRRFNRLLLGAIPYVFFLIAITVMSVGFCNYIEKQSILAIFLTQRDTVIPSDDWNGKDWSSKAVSDDAPVLDGSKRAIVRDNERLLVPFFYVGEQIGKLEFTRIGLVVPVIQGDSEAQFQLGSGHSLGSYLPGQDNNIVIGGHRNTHFRKLEYVKVGDRIIFNAAYGDFTYQIDEIRIINGGDNSIAKPTSKEQLTLYTCYPFNYFGNAPKRYVVICSLLESEIFK